MAASTAQAFDCPGRVPITYHSITSDSKNGKGADLPECSPPYPLSQNWNELEVQSQEQRPADIEAIETWSAGDVPNFASPHNDYDSIYGRETFVISVPIQEDSHLDLPRWRTVRGGVPRRLQIRERANFAVTVSPMCFAVDPLESTSLMTRSMAGPSNSSVSTNYKVLPSEASDDEDFTGSSDGYDSIPDLISISDEDEDDPLRQRYWDADSMADLEFDVDGDVSWQPHQRIVDESLFDSDEEEQMHARWAELEHFRSFVSEKSSSSSSESALSDGATEEKWDESISERRCFTSRKRNAQRSKTKTHQSASSSPHSDPGHVMHRVTNFDEDTFVKIQEWLESALDSRARLREPAGHSSSSTSSLTWYEPVPLSLSPDDGIEEERNRRGARSRWFLNTSLNHSEANWRQYRMFDGRVRRLDGGDVERRASSSVVTTSLLGGSVSP